VAIVNDVDAAITFYTKHLDFKLEMHPAPPFAMLSKGDLRLVLSAPQSLWRRRPVDARRHQAGARRLEPVRNRGHRSCRYS